MKLKNEFSGLLKEEMTAVKEKRSSDWFLDQMLQKYKGSIYTKKGDISIKTVRSLAKEICPQIPSEDIFISETSGALCVYYEACDLRGGGSENETKYIIAMIEYVKRKWFSDVR